MSREGIGGGPKTAEELFAPLFSAVPLVTDQQLSDALQGKITIHKPRDGESEPREIRLTEGCRRMSVPRKMVLLNLGCHVLRRVGKIGDMELFPNVNWYARGVQMSPATIEKAKQWLHDQGYFSLMSQGSGIPLISLPRAVEFIKTTKLIPPPHRRYRRWAGDRRRYRRRYKHYGASASI